VEEDLGKAVVQQVDAGGGAEHRARAALHAGIIPDAPVGFK
jgi:hypothetical protein